MDIEEGWETLYRSPVPWDGSPDVQYDYASQTYRFVYPVGIDIGADLVSNGTGKGVTVAVVDSGVYFDPIVSEWMNLAIQEQFIGQADFADPVCPKLYKTIIGQQKTDHCFMDSKYSKDPYGHGSHVTGIIWNNISDQNTGKQIGIAPKANVLSVRVLGADGSGSYASVIAGIQYVLANKNAYNIRIMNLSLSAAQTVPYFMDPLNRAVEKAWQAGIVVVAAAGNEGPAAETISVPGNDPYVITVGAVDGRRTSGYWKDDIIPSWSASGPTKDGFLKPDILAPGTQVVSFMHNGLLPSQRASLVTQHPDYSMTSSLFRMNGTSMATGVVSGVVALMLEQNPNLTPDQVKYRLMATARQVSATDGQPAFGLLQQGAGRVWAPDAISAVLPEGSANVNMDLSGDLSAGWGTYDASGQPVLDTDQLAKHYLGSVRSLRSDDGMYQIYYVVSADGTRVVLGISDAQSMQWMQPNQLAEGISWTSGHLIWSEDSELLWTEAGLSWYSDALFDGSGKMIWSGGELVWNGNGLFDTAGKMIWSGGDLFDAAGKMVWSGGKMVWSGANGLSWSGVNWEWSSEALFDGAGKMIWSGGKMIWSGGQLFDAAGVLVWPGGVLFNAAGKMVWSGGKMVWSGAELADAAGRLIWAGGKMIWSGGLLQSSTGSSFSPTVYDTSFAGENLSWSSGRMIWSGGKLVWSGGVVMVWSGNSSSWAAGKMVWSGGRMIWSGSLDWTTSLNAGSTSIQSSRWVDW